MMDVSNTDLYERPMALVNTGVFVGWNYGVVAGDVSKLVAVKSKVPNGKKTAGNMRFLKGHL